MTTIKFINERNLFSEGLAGQLAVITEPICSQAPAEIDCEAQLPQFFGNIAQYLFSPTDGWFAPANLCEVWL